MKNISSSKIALAVVVLTLLLLQYIRYPNQVLSWDVFGYYLYLPFNFIYADPLLENHETLLVLWNKYHPSSGLYQAYEVSPGNWIFRYTMGLAILKAPFFFLGHLTAMIGGWETDGFSKPYAFFIHAGSICYSIFSLVLLRKILKFYFSENTTALTLLFLFFGTNLMIHLGCYGQEAMPHGYALFLYTVIIFCTVRYYQNFKRKYIIYLGLSMGILILSRPSELVCLLIPLLWGVTSGKTLHDRLKLILQKRKEVYILVGILLSIGMMQFIYWFVETGQLFFSSYNNPGEGMVFLRPYILEMLFSYRKGWWVYTPLMLLSIAGVWFMIKPGYSFTWTVIAYIVVTIYIVGSWSNYWYAESFSQRSMIPSYAIMALMLAAIIERLVGVKYYIFIGICIALTMLNIFQSWQFDKGIIHANSMSREYYWSVFMQTTLPTAEQRELLLRSKEFKPGEVPVTNEILRKSFVYRSDSSSLVGEGQEKSLMSVVYNEISTSSYAWAKIEVKVDSLAKVSDKISLKVKMGRGKGSAAYRMYFVELTKLKKNTLGNYEFYYLFPEIRDKKADVFHVELVNRSNVPFYLQQYKIEILEPVNDVHIF